MKHNYTFNYLIKYLYKETSLLRTFEIENEIENDGKVKKEFERLKKAYRMLPKVSFYPSDTAITNILEYSKKRNYKPSF